MTADPAPIPLALAVAQATGTELIPDATTPEQQFISALLESGTYNPRAYGVPDVAIRGNKALHEFCKTHQERDGYAPSIELVRSMFPSFVFIPGVGPGWAAHEVNEAETNRALRKGISKALVAVGDEAHGEAIGILRDTVQSITTSNRPGTLITDFQGTRSALSRPVCPVPPGLLSGLTGGHGAGQLWLIAALWGVGKTWKLLEHALAGAESSWNVLIFSMEMHTQQILERLRVLALRHMGVPIAALSLDEQERLIAEWAEGCGRIEVRGPDQGRVDVSTIAGAVTDEKTLVIVDYVGKMYATDGRHAGSGHEVMSLVSKELQQTAGLLNIPILAAAQINRVGQVAGTVSLEQDADLILEMKRVSESINGIRKNEIKKTRHTALIAPWYSRFDAVLGRFDDITHEEAMTLRMAEEQLLYT
jgi:KaiC/GvpD/RAD55 family RecA-like ATPase